MKNISLKLSVLIFTSQSTIFSVMSGLFLRSTKLRIKCLARGHNTVPPLSIEPETP